MPTGKNEVKSLRSLTATATVTHFFGKDKTLLPKVYRHGILPVRIINEIYCLWVRDAIVKARTKLASTYENYAKEHKGMRVAKSNLNIEELMYPRNEPLINQLRDEWNTRVAQTRTNFEKYKAEYKKLTKTIAVFSTMFKLSERDEIMKVSQNQDMGLVRDELLQLSTEADNNLKHAPVRFTSWPENGARILVHEVDELCQ